MPITSKLDNTTALNNGGSWNAGVPNSTSVAQWNLVTQRNAALGGSITMGCLSNIGSALAFCGNTNGATLTIAGSATDVPGYVGYGVKIDNGSASFQCLVTVTNNQYWYVVSGRYIDIGIGGRAWGGTGKITLDAISGFYSYVNSTHTGTIEVERGLLCGVASISAPFGAAGNTFLLTGTLGEVALGTNAAFNVLMPNNIVLTPSVLTLYNTSNGGGYLQLTGTIALNAPTTTTFQIGNVNYIDGNITGSNGLTLVNSSVGYFAARSGYVYIRGTNPNLYGTVTINNSSQTTTECGLRPGTHIGENLPNVSTYVLTNRNSVMWTRAQNYAVSSVSTNATFSGLGWVWPGATTNATLTYTFSNENALSGLTGNIQPGTSLLESGLLIYSDNTSPYCVTAFKDFPAIVQYYSAGTTASSSQVGRYISSKATHNYTTTKIYINNGSTGAVIGNMELYADQGTGALVLGDGTTATGIHKIGSMTGNMNFTLRGSNTSNNTMAGVIQATSGTLGLIKTDGGRWILSAANTFTGPITLTAGFLGVTNGAGLGAVTSTGTCTLTAGRLQISGDITVNKSGTPFTTTGTTIENLSGANTLSMSTLAMNNSFAITVTSGSLNITNAITGAVGPGTGYTLTLNCSGSLRLSNTGSSYANTTAITSGTVEVTKLNTIGQPSSIGAPAAGNATIVVGDFGSVVISHIGTTADTCDRPFDVVGGNGTSLTLGSNGTGAAALSFSGTMSFSGAGSHTLVLEGTNSVTNTYSGSIQNGVSGNTNITKNGGNTWHLTGSIAAQGVMTINGGLVYLGAFSRVFDALTINAGNVTIATGSQIEADTTINVGLTFTPVLAGAGTFAVASGITESAPVRLVPDSLVSSNTFTGDTTINGCVDLIGLPDVDVGISGNGEFFGQNNTVTINGGGMIRTKSYLTSDQRGRARYNNLTINTGAVFKYGLAS